MAWIDDDDGVLLFKVAGEVTAAVSFFQSAMMANDRVNPMHPQRQALALFIISCCRFPHHGKLTWTLELGHQINHPHPACRL